MKKKFLLFMFLMLVCWKGWIVNAAELSDCRKTAYTISDFCNAELRSCISYRTFGCYPEKGLDSFINNESSYYLKYNTETRPVHDGKILVIGSEGDEISSMIAMQEENFLKEGYYGKERPGGLKFTYMQPSDIKEDSFDGFDMVIMESGVKDEEITEETLLLLHNKVLESVYIIYDMDMVDPYYALYSGHLQMTFNPDDGSLTLMGAEFQFKDKERAAEYYSDYLKNMVSTEFGSLSYGNEKKQSFSLEDVKYIKVMPYPYKTTIGNYSFCCFENLKSIEIPGRQCNDYIGFSAFENCIYLEDFDFSSVTEIFANAFNNCKGLTEIQFPDSLDTIGNYAFKSTGLKEITLPKSLVKIGEGSFRDLENLQCLSIDLNENGLVIGGNAFANCSDCSLSITYGEKNPARIPLFSLFEENQCEQNFANFIKYTEEEATLRYVGDKAAEYTIMLNAGGGSFFGDATVVVSVDSVYPEFPKVTREGFEFLGWYTDEGRQIMTGDPVEISRDITLTARWKEKENTANRENGVYEVTLIDTFSGFVLDTIQVKNGEKWGDYLYSVESLRYDTYSLDYVGWMFENHTKVNIQDVINLNQDICLYTRYKRNGVSDTHTISFPEYDQTISVCEGDEIPFEKFPKYERKDDILLGWSLYFPLETEEDITFLSDTPIIYNYAQDIKLYAVWKSSIDNHNISTNETLSMERIYYNNDFTDSTFFDEDEESYKLNFAEYNQDDISHAKWLYHKIMNIGTKNGKVMVLPKGHSFNLKKKYKKYGVIETEWKIDEFLRAISCMNKMFFQNLNYTDNIEVDIDTLLKNTEWGNDETETAFDIRRHMVCDFVDNSIPGAYVIRKSMFVQYDGYCKEIDNSLDQVIRELEFSTSTKITDAIKSVNDWLAANMAYDYNYRIYNLAWMFKSTAQDAWYLHELERDGGTGDFVREHHGVCNAYALFATALFAKCGYYAPKVCNINEPDEKVIHAFNLTKINGKELYTDYCWSDVRKVSDNPKKFKGSLTFLFLDRDSVNKISMHKNPYVVEAYKETISFQAEKYSSLKGIKITGVKNLKGKKVELKLDADKAVSKIQIAYSTNKNFEKAKKIEIGNKKCVILKKLKKNATYYIKVRAIRKLNYVDEEYVKKKACNVYGSWSKIKKIKIKK